jgi:hypothetical protein
MAGARSRRGAFVAAAAMVSAAGVALACAGRVDVGFYYDDYHMVRPWTAIDLHRVWYGPWDPTGIESAFFRPLTAMLFAARFDLFGLNSATMHAVSVAGHALCALLVALVLAREQAHRGVALFGAWIYAIHPLFPYSQVSWLTNQMHLTQSAIVLAALLVWQSVRERGLGWWLPIAALAVGSFLVKEDGVMLLPALGALTLLRVWLLQRPAPRRWVLLALAAMATTAALVAFRHDRLGRLGGYGAISLEQGVTNLRKGIEQAVFLWPTTRIWQAVAAGVGIAAALTGAAAAWRSRARIVAAAALLVAAALALTIPAAFSSRVSYSVLAWQGLASGVAIAALALGAGAAIARRDRHAGWLIALGLLLALAFNLPFVFVSKREQFHLLALGAVLAMSGAAQAVLPGVSSIMRRRAAWAVAVAATAPFLAGARHLGADFLPCAPPVLAADREARGWWVVPDEMRGWLDEKAARCAAGQSLPALTELPLIVWGLHEEQRDESGVFRWTADQAVHLVREDAAALTLAMRRPDATASAPVRVTIEDGRAARTVTLDSGEWTYATVTLERGVRSRLRRGHLVVLTVDRWFVPAVRDPRSADLRRFGVQLRVGAASGSFLRLP